MSDLKLDSLRIQNFRTFKDLTIDRLGQVNLVVGENNVGKTAFLEALWVRGHPEYWQDLAKSIESKFPMGEGEPQSSVIKRRYHVIRDYFHNRPGLASSAEMKVRIGPTDGSAMQLSLERTAERRKLVEQLYEATPAPYLQVVAGPWKDEIEEGSAISIREPDQSDLRYSEEVEGVNFVASDGISIEEAGQFWDRAIRANRKQAILEILRVLVPDLKDLNWIGDSSFEVRFSGDTARFSPSDNGRVPMLSFPHHQEAVSLSSLGEGVSRALWIGSSIVNSKEGLLLVDEVENGLHYSVQPDLWKMIFKTARQLDVQVFATTHSHDCVRAFQQVSKEQEEEGMLISLRRKQSDSENIVAVPIEEDELEYAVKSHTDVR